ncbi:MAG: glycine dehydrogenase (aminomethyl-transferring) [Bacillaceae bacterium G1]|nr:aminomethyl-transferring glycine dehydrogenase [Bacillota bacterium]OJF16482.1 MAG: glycine dehydrogenase (aminomethyl-transferring) [Bacillaceae bacterium G1]
MTHRYLPTTEEDREAMLKAIGVSRVDELFAVIPSEIRLKEPLALPEPLSEPGLLREFRRLAAKNANLYDVISFLGAGMYEHHIPAVVDFLLSRGEFLTAYTPYQAEMSQGELQAMFEFQSMLCELTGMDVANSSMYDGATAMAEAAGMACGATRRSRVLVSRAVHPEWRAVLRTYLHGLGCTVEELPYEASGTEAGRTSFTALREQLDDTVAAVIVQSPNFFGVIEDAAPWAEMVHQAGGLLIAAVNPVSLGVLKPPGEWGADVVVGDAQPLGMPVAFGGPSCGFFAAKIEHVRRMPGRIVGQTVDRDGRRGFVLTLQAREQHIRREKATSNICTNQALNALAAAMTMSALGPQGLAELGRLNVQKAHYACRRLAAVPGVEVRFAAPFFNEFVLRIPGPADEFEQHMLKAGILPGYHLGRDFPELTDHWLVAVTEVRTKEDIDQFASVLEGWV